MGAGAASRSSLGTTVFGGMIAVTFLGLVFTPVFYVTIERLRERRAPAAEHGGAPAPQPAESCDARFHHTQRAPGRAGAGTAA